MSFNLSILDSCCSSWQLTRITGPIVWSNGRENAGRNLRETKTCTVHRKHIPCSWGRSGERDPLHNQRPPWFLHHQRRPHRFLQLLPHRPRRFLRRGAPNMGLRVPSKLHSPLLYSHRQGHLRSRSLRSHGRRPQVRCVAVPKTAQQTTQTQVQVGVMIFRHSLIYACIFLLHHITYHHSYQNLTIHNSNLTIWYNLTTYRYVS